jgi:bifunctional DNA primase/polymerase-like protein/AAA domain-containing protein
MVEHTLPVPPLGNTPGVTTGSARDPEEARSLAGARALREALRLARAGYVLVPVTVRRDDAGKKRAQFHTSWSDGGSSRTDVVRDWSVQHPACSFAVLCGPSGIEVVDLDLAEGGPAWWAENGMPSSDVIVDTPSGGQHLWFRRRPGAEPEDRLINNAGQVAPGVDARTVGGVVFAPGSYVVGEEDQPYAARVEIPEADRLQETPRAVLGLWSRARAAKPRREFTPGEVDQARRFTQDEAVAYVQAEAQRPLLDAQFGVNVNDTLNRSALVLGHFTPEFFTEDEARAALRTWLLAGPGQRNGWRELDKSDRDSIDSGMRRGMSEPYARRAPLGSNHLADGVPNLEPDLGHPNPSSSPDRFAGLPVPTAGSAQEVAPGMSLADLPEPPTALEVALERGRIQRAVRRLLDAEERPADPGPGGVRLAAFLAEPEEATPSRVDGLWPIQGKVLMVAPAKAGKTTMVMNLVRALVDAGHGARFLERPAALPTAAMDWKVAASGYGVAPLDPGRRVALMDFEMTRPLLRQWLRDMRMRNADGLVVETMRGRSWDIRDPQIRAQWASWLAAEAVQVLVVDPIGPILHGLGIDENDNSAVGGFLAALDALVRESGVGELFVVHHAGHSGERGRGASSFLGWPDVNWNLGRDEITGARGFRAEGRDVYSPDTVLEHDRPTHRLWLGQGSRAEVAGNADADVVAMLVREECETRGPGQPGPGVRDLVKKLKSGDTTGETWGNPRAEKAITAARNLGLIHYHPGSAYPGQQPSAKLHHPGSEGCDECPPSAVS